MKLLNAELDVKNLYIKQDAATGLIALIAIHNTTNGPALGGCRFVNYATVDDAISDVTRLARAMTYKSAMAGLPLGGGKSVIISHPGIKDKQKIFEQFGDFVETLNGEYITASDSGTSEAEMKIVATRTKHVTSINKSSESLDDTAYMTSVGLVRAMEAAVAYRLNKDSLSGVRVAIQGAGNVGYLVAKMLLEKGANVVITDKNEALLAARASELSIDTTVPDAIAEMDCDIFAPCALGGVMNNATITKLKAPIVCGAANNQLQDQAAGEQLHASNILYIPDYVANAGGVICAAAQAGTISKDESWNKMLDIYESVTNIVSLSKEMQKPTHFVANYLAEQKF